MILVEVRGWVSLVLFLLGVLSGCGSSGPTGVTPAPSPGIARTPAPTLAPVPAPSVTALEADQGPFAVGTLAVSPSAAVGYGGGTISYPTDTSEGPFGAVAVCPGYTGVQRSMQWLGPRLASGSS